jgi:hypothetical protein
MHWLLHNRAGAALVRRLQKRKEAKMPESFEKMVKDMGVTRVCKAICDLGDGSRITEKELTEAITEHAKRLHPDLKPDAAFAKVFTSQDATGITTTIDAANRAIWLLARGQCPQSARAVMATVCDMNRRTRPAAGVALQTTAAARVGVFVVACPGTFFGE